MNPVIEALLEVIEKEPYPAGYTSSYWQEYGAKNIVERGRVSPITQGYGLGEVFNPGVRGRTLHVLERLSYWQLTAGLRHYPSVWQAAKRLARDLSFRLTFAVWKSAVALAVLADHWTEYRLSPRTFALIGDGYGFLGALIRRYQPGSRMYCIDLPKTLVFQAQTHEMADRRVSLSVLSTDGVAGADVVFVLPQDVERITDDIDCAINIASMQEMNEFSITSYFSFLRRRSAPHSRFYCVNRLRKELPGGEISAFNDYPWHSDDEIFIDGLCPYYTRFFGLPTLPNGPRLLGVRVPCINYFGGVHMHRLVRLAPLGKGKPRTGLRGK